MEFSVIDFRTIIVVSFSNFRLLQVVFVIRGGGRGDSEGCMEDIYINQSTPLCKLKSEK